MVKLINLGQILTLACLITLAQGVAKHEQVHLSLGTTETEMVVTWTTITKVAGTPQVEFGLDAAHLNHSAHAVVEQFHKFYFTYRALMTGLEPGTIYHYKVGSTGGQWSQTFQFRTLKEGHEWLPRVAIYGDLGLQNDRTLPYLSKEVDKHEYDTVFHIGDLAYDLNERETKQGNDFMNQIEPVAARVPYMTCPGNHEQHQNFTHYDSRFSMIGDRHHPDHKAPLRHRLNNHFWSVDIGPAHFLLFSTEFYDYTNYGWEQIVRQYHFMEEDLKRANANRAQRPWIIVMGHKPLYCTNVANWSIKTHLERTHQRNGVHMHGKTSNKLQYGLEELFHREGVDLQFYGHEHSYARLLPMYNFKVTHGNDTKNPYDNPTGPIHIVTGSAGNREVAVEHNKHHPAWIAARSFDYGYTRLTFKSVHEILLEQLSDNKHGQVVDKIDIIKSQPKPKWMPH